MTLLHEAAKKVAASQQPANKIPVPDKTTTQARHSQVNQAYGTLGRRISENYRAIKIGQVANPCHCRILHPENRPLMCLINDQVAASQLKPDHLQAIRKGLNDEKYDERDLRSKDQFKRYHDDFIALVRQNVPGFKCSYGLVPDFIDLSNEQDETSSEKSPVALSKTNGLSNKRNAGVETEAEASKRIKRGMAEEDLNKLQKVIAGLKTDLSREKASHAGTMELLREVERDLKDHKTASASKEHELQNTIITLESKVDQQQAQTFEQVRDHDALCQDLKKTIRILEEKLEHTPDLPERFALTWKYAPQESMKAYQVGVERKLKMEEREKKNAAALAAFKTKRDQIQGQYKVLVASLKSEEQNVKEKWDLEEQKHKTRINDLKTKEEALKAKQELEAKQYETRMAEIKAQEEAFMENRDLKKTGTAP